MAVLRQGLAVLWILFAADSASAAEEFAPGVPPDGAMTQGWYGNFSDTSPLSKDDTSGCWDSLTMTQGACGVVSELLALEQFDQRAGFEASLGYRFSSGFQIAGEIRDWRRDFSEPALSRLEEYELSNGLAAEPALMLSGTYSFDAGSGFRPFVGAGIGGVHVQNDLAIAEAAAFSESEPAWKLGVEGFAGLQYEFGPDMKIGLRYSQKLISNWDSGSGDAANISRSEPPDLRNKALMLTFTYAFGGS
jgi:opacity protein-like surface antigen